MKLITLELERHLVDFIRICRVMVRVLASSMINHGFELRLVQTKDYKIGICCSFAKHVVLMSRNKDWLARNQVNVFA